MAYGKMRRSTVEKGGLCDEFQTKENEEYFLIILLSHKISIRQKQLNENNMTFIVATMENRVGGRGWWWKPYASGIVNNPLNIRFVS